MQFLHFFTFSADIVNKEKTQGKSNNSFHVLTTATEIDPQSLKEEINPRLHKFVYFLNLVG